MISETIAHAECGMWSAACKTGIPHSECRMPHCVGSPLTQRLRRRNGQASFETGLAFFCGLLLLLASMKIFFWFGERLVGRQVYFECSRGMAGQQTPNESRYGGPVWGGTYVVGKDGGNADLIDSEPKKPGPDGKKETCRPPDLSKPLRIFGG